jgi:hypothetical protein
MNYRVADFPETAAGTPLPFLGPSHFMSLVTRALNRYRDSTLRLGQ